MELGDGGRSLSDLSHLASGRGESRLCANDELVQPGRCCGVHSSPAARSFRHIDRLAGFDPAKCSDPMLVLQVAPAKTWTNCMLCLSLKPVPFTPVPFLFFKCLKRSCGRTAALLQRSNTCRPDRGAKFRHVGIRSNRNRSDRESTGGYRRTAQLHTGTSMRTNRNRCTVGYLSTQ